MVNKFWALSWSFLILTTAVAAQKQIPPKSNRLVNDYAGMLSRDEAALLEGKLVAYNDSTSTQIAIVIEKSLEGDDIFDYSVRLAQEWGIGREGKDNGVLIYVAQDDRKVRIQTGYGMEGFLTDAMSKRIIENVIVPNFREARYYQGLDRATDLIIQLGSGEYSADGLEAENIPIGLIVFLIIMIIVIIIVLSNMGGGGGYYRGGRYDTNRGGGWIIFGPGGGSGGGGWSGGGGGFGGFGGGSFGGGGAGGSW